jgi:hypothetical protein
MTSSQEHPLSHFSLIPADSISVYYHVETQQMVLTAKGTVHEITKDIAFYRDCWLGGLKFELKGWVGPILGPGNDRNYEVSTSFDIPWPSRVAPSGNIIVITANHPEGELIEVVTETLLSKRSPLSVPAATAATEPQNFVAPGESIFVPVHGRFAIRQAVDELKLGHSIDATFHAAYLKLVKARFEGKDIVWTFEALSGGETEVVVGVGNINPPYVYIKTWQVTIGVTEPQPENKS